MFLSNSGDVIGVPPWFSSLGPVVCYVNGEVMVRVRRYGHAARYPAKVLCTSSQVDLALLEVASEAFWAPPVSALELSEDVPDLDADVLTVGYPMGGENICVTRGVAAWPMCKARLSL